MLTQFGRTCAILSEPNTATMQPNLMPFWVFLALVLLTAWVWRIVRGDY